MSPQERLALGVIGVLLAAGAAVEALRPPPPPVEWDGGSEPIGALEDRAAAELQREERSSTPLADDERIDLNRADATEIERLPRIGPALAARIVEHRTAHGEFRTLADLDSVSGIGPALLAAVAPHVALPPAPMPRAVARTAMPRTVSSSAPATGATLLDLNTATAAELDALPGIGPALAEAILRWREENGGFRSVQDLEKVRGIGPHKLEQLAALVRASP